MKQRNLIIIGAAGRDFHNFNTRYRDDAAYNVVAFTAAQIPDIADKPYPASLAGSLYPNGIPIKDEKELERLIKEYDVDECVFAYSDVSYEAVMGISAKVNAAGADFTLLGHKDTMIKSTKPVISIGAIRTGCGKSQTSCRIIEILMKHGLKVIAIRHPMPYGDLEKQKVQRFATMEDLDKHKCTIEEREEYEPHVKRGNVIYAGVDYEAILREAENDPNGCDVILWDGGNNDFPFYQTDLMITVVDPLRSGDELSYYPGEVTLRLADIVVINKIDSADFEDIQTVRENIKKVNPNAEVVDAASPIRVDDINLAHEVINGKKVLIIEDGPTLTHGGAKVGAATIAAKKYGAANMIDPKSSAVGKIKDTYEKYPKIGDILPAMGYGEEQVRDLAATIEAVDCDSVIIGTPMNLTKLININKPNIQIHYDLQEIGKPDMNDVLADFIKKAKK